MPATWWNFLFGKYLLDGLVKGETNQVLATLVLDAPQFDNRLKAALGIKAIPAFLKPWSVRFCKVRLTTYKAVARIVSQHKDI